MRRRENNKNEEEEKEEEEEEEGIKNLRKEDNKIVEKGKRKN